MSVELKCVQEFWGNGKIKSEEFRNQHGIRHHAAGPAVRVWHENGQIAYEMYYLNGELHTAAGLAYRSWHENGQLACEAYYLNGKLHNESGPAIREWCENGQLIWEICYRHGNRHNAAGPAHRAWHENGQLRLEEYWLDGHHLTKSYWETLVKPSPCDGQIVEIEGRRYKLVAE